MSADCFKRHGAFGLLLLAGIVLRALVKMVYPAAFFYYGDSWVYMNGARTFIPDYRRPFGYSALLWKLNPVGELSRVADIQHIAGLLMAVVIYWFLRRRQVGQLVACLGVAPLLLDPRTVVIEHYILAEAFFTWLMVAGLLVVCRRGRLGVGTGIVAGVLFAGAALTRSVALALLPIVLVYLLVKRVPLRVPVTFVMVVCASLAGYLNWYNTEAGSYSFGTYSGRFLWSRVSTFVDCDQLELTDAERTLCPQEPAGHRQDPDWYLWSVNSVNERLGGRESDPLFASFARKAILAQPLDYARTIAVDTGVFLMPDGGRVDRSGHSIGRTDCLTSLWDIPAPHSKPKCSGSIALGTLTDFSRGPLIAPQDGKLPRVLSAYSRHCHAPLTLIGLAFAFVIALMVRPRRRLGFKAGLDALLWVGLAFAMLVGAVGTSALDPRYGMPAMPLAGAGAALAWQAYRRSTATAGKSATVEQSDAAASSDEPADAVPQEASLLA